MAGNFKVGDLVWAKMKGFPNWPGKVIAPKPEVKRPATKKNQQFVFFFGSENYAWIPEENMHIYADSRNRFMLTQRIPRGYKEAIEAIEDALKKSSSDKQDRTSRAKPCNSKVNPKTSELPSIEEELAQIFPQRKDAPQRDYSRDTGRKRKRSPPPAPATPTPQSAATLTAKARLLKDRRASAPPAPIRGRRRSSQDEQKKNGKTHTAGSAGGRELPPKSKRTERGTSRPGPGRPLSKVSTSTIASRSFRKVKGEQSATMSAEDLENADAVESSEGNANNHMLDEGENMEEEVLSDSEIKDEWEENDAEQEEEGFLPGTDTSLHTQSLGLFYSDGEEQGPDNSKKMPAEGVGTDQNGGEHSPQHEPGGPEAIDSKTVEHSEPHDLEEAVESKSAVSSQQDATSSNTTSAAVSSAVDNIKELSSSSRGENIFEMFSPKDGAAARIYHDDTVDTVDDEEDDKEHDDVEYAVVTVDPDGQAHVLLNAETIMDDEVVVLGQEEEVETEDMTNDDHNADDDADAEDVEFKTKDEKPLSDLGSTEKVLTSSSKLDVSASDQDVGRKNPSKDLGESVDNIAESADSMEPDTALKPGSPLDSLFLQEEEEDARDFEGKLDDDIHIKPDNPLLTVEIFGRTNDPIIDSTSQNPRAQSEEDEKKDSEKASSGTDLASASSSSVVLAKAEEKDSFTPTRRSARMRQRKEDAAKEKSNKNFTRVKKKEDDSKPAATHKTERKGREVQKTDVKVLANRRHSAAKRPASPVSTTPASKRGKVIGRPPGSPGRSAAPAEFKPLGGLPVDTIEPAVAGPPRHDIIPTPLKIGFLGLGIMGNGMVNNLLRSGHEVTVWNRTAQKCREFVKSGALKGNTPAEVVAACDVTFSCVSDPAAVKDLVFGNCGVLQGIQPGKGYVEMSTIDPDTVADVHEAVTSQGGRFLEAPVVGSRGPAQSGDLVILAAGDRTLYEDCYSCFEALGKKTFFLGETTSGCKMKLVVNMLMGTMVAGLAESLALADKVGLDQDALLQILDLSVLSCPLVRNKGQSIMMSRFEPQFPLQHQQKDLRLTINMADSVDQPLHVATAVNELFKKAKAKGYSQHDMCAIYRAADM